MLFDTLVAKAKSVETRTIISLFDDSRASDFSVTADGLLFDYSKTNIDAETRDLLIEIANKTGVADKRAAMFGGAAILSLIHI